MPIIGITLDASREYRSKFDTADKKEATVFTIGTLDSRIFGLLRDKATTIQVDPSKGDEEVTTALNINEVNFLTVQYGLKGWKNFRDSGGNDIEFRTVRRSHGGHSYSIVDPEMLKRIPSVVITELAEEIRKENELSETDAKN